jgi:drug/metabolite transporter (DMT)-like permease
VVVLLSLASALTYGLSDFLGGILSRRTSPWVIAVSAQTTAMVLWSAIALAAGGEPTGRDLAWGILSGVGGGIGAAFLYRGLGAGSMSVVAPVSAVGSALIPVAAGFVGGERPTAITWLGVLVALPAIWLVSLVDTSVAPADGRPRRGRAAELTDAMLAGLGFGVLFTALGQVPEQAGLAPLAVSYVVAVVATAALAAALGAAWLPRDRSAVSGIGVGLLGSSATVLFLLATQSGLLTIAAVLSSLYPATTVLLAAVLLRERISRAQGGGLALAALAVVLVTVG